MFDTKYNVNDSEFASYLDEKRQCLAITDLNDQQYLIFQREVLDTLNAIKLLLYKVEKFLDLESNSQYFNEDAMKKEIYNLHILSGDDSQYFKNIIKELVERMASCYWDGVSCRSTSQYRGVIRDISRRIEEIKDSFFKHSMQKSSLLSVVSPIVTDEKTYSLENKYLLYQNLINLTSEFSSSSKVFSIPNSPEFLAHFYNDYYNVSQNTSTPRIEYKDVKELKEMLSSKLNDADYLLGKKEVLLKVRVDLGRYSKLTNRIFKRKELNDLWELARSHIDNFIMNSQYSLSDTFLKEYEKVKKYHPYYSFRHFCFLAVCEVRAIHDVHEESLRILIDNYFTNVTNALKFLSNEKRYNLPFMNQDQLDETVEYARLLNYFFYAYREIPGISLTDEELIKLIKENRESIQKFIKGLMGFIDEYFKQESELEDENLFATYFDCMENSRKLTEQQVIDHVIQKMLTSTQKS